MLKNQKDFINKTNQLFTKVQINTSFFNKHEKSCLILVITIITYHLQNKSAFYQNVNRKTSPKAKTFLLKIQKYFINKTSQLFTKMQIKTSFFDKHCISYPVFILIKTKISSTKQVSFLPKCKQKDEPKS